MLLASDSREPFPARSRGCVCPCAAAMVTGILLTTWLVQGVVVGSQRNWPWQRQAARPPRCGGRRWDGAGAGKVAVLGLLGAVGDNIPLVRVKPWTPNVLLWLQVLAKGSACGRLLER